MVEVILESVRQDARGLMLAGKEVKPWLQREARSLNETIEDVVADQSRAKVCAAAVLLSAANASISNQQDCISIMVSLNDFFCKDPIVIRW